MYQRVDVPARPELWTFQDAMDLLSDRFGELTTGGRHQRLLRDSVLAAYRDLPKYHPWSYYKRKSGFSSEAAYSTGTIAYSTSTNQMTLTDGTWPANAEFGNVRIGRDHWQVYRRVSDTVLTMDARHNPPSDIAAGTAFEWYRDSYPFPSLTRKLGRLYGGDNYNELPYVDPEQGNAIGRSRVSGTINWPELYTIRNDNRYLNSLSIVLIPPPNAVISYSFVEHPGGQPLTTERYSTGTATVNGSPTPTTTVSFGGGATLDAAIHTGCVLRLTTSPTQEPTSIRGNYDSTGAVRINEYSHQRIIVSVDSPTSVTVDSSIDVDLTGVKYTISSPIDVEYTSMLSCFWSLCEWEFAKNTMADGKTIGQARHRFYEDLKFAQSEDSRSTHVKDGNMRGGYSPFWFPVGDVSVV